MATKRLHGARVITSAFDSSNIHSSRIEATVTCRPLSLLGIAVLFSEYYRTAFRGCQYTIDFFLLLRVRGSGSGTIGRRVFCTSISISRFIRDVLWNVYRQVCCSVSQNNV